MCIRDSMYPSIKFDLIRKAINHYSRSLNQSLKDTVLHVVCLDLIKVGMNTTILTFDGNYYLYDGDKKVEERGLTIGGYESAWLADLAMAFLLETIDQSILEELKYFGIYRDDGIGIFNGTVTQAQVDTWLNRFQDSVNEQSGNDFLKFTAVIWKPNEPPAPAINKTTVATEDFFPFLDMELRWDSNTELSFGVYMLSLIHI